MIQHRRPLYVDARPSSLNTNTLVASAGVAAFLMSLVVAVQTYFRRSAQELPLAFATSRAHAYGTRGTSISMAAETGEKVSPFEEGGAQLPPHDEDASDALTEKNVQRVLDEVRPYLIADGGNVDLVGIEGKIVKLQLQGACGSCPSSTTTMTMGIKRRLKEEIPSIEDVEEVASEKKGMALNADNVEKVLADIRPFLNPAGGGEVTFHSIDGGIVKVILTGPVKKIMTIRVAITQKLRENIPDILAVQLL